MCFSRLLLSGTSQTTVKSGAHFQIERASFLSDHPRPYALSRAMGTFSCPSGREIWDGVDFESCFRDRRVWSHLSVESNKGDWSCRSPLSRLCALIAG
jgi:hypothetical protein